MKFGFPKQLRTLKFAVLGLQTPQKPQPLVSKCCANPLATPGIPHPSPWWGFTFDPCITGRGFVGWLYDSLQNLSSEPEVALLFCSSKLYHCQKTMAARPRARMTTPAYSAEKQMVDTFLRSQLPAHCQVHGATAGGVVGKIKSEATQYPIPQIWAISSGFPGGFCGFFFGGGELVLFGGGEWKMQVQ